MSKKGFACLTPERRSEIARLGGNSVPPEKRSFSTNRALAASAGRKGGMSVPPEKRAWFKNRELASSAGRKGGQHSGN